MTKGKTFIVSGPSGVGKSTVLHALLERRKNLYFSVSATTRDPRPGELDGIHYHFMDVESFRKWIAMRSLGLQCSAVIMASNSFTAFSTVSLMTK